MGCVGERGPSTLPCPLVLGWGVWQGGMCLVFLGSTVCGPWMSIELGHEHQFSGVGTAAAPRFPDASGTAVFLVQRSGRELCLEPVYSAHGNFIMSSNKLLPEWSSPVWAVLYKGTLPETPPLDWGPEGAH